MDGNGPSRRIHLVPVRLFACKMTELLFPLTDPMPINKIVPAYVEKFKNEFNPSNYGFPKLIRALEAVQDLILVSGECRARVEGTSGKGHSEQKTTSLRRDLSCVSEGLNSFTDRAIPQGHPGARD